MEVIKVKNYEELSKVAADIIAELLKEKPDATLGLATGSSPIGLYQYLIDAYNSNKTIIPYEEIKNIGCLIKEGYFAPVDYIKVVKEKYFEK